MAADITSIVLKTSITMKIMGETSTGKMTALLGIFPRAFTLNTEF